MNIQEQIIEQLTPDLIEEMKHIWFIADIHAHHPKIVDICNRPVPIPEKEIAHIPKEQRNIGTPEYKRILDKIHNEWLLREVYNKYIERKDEVYIIGDLSLGKRRDAELWVARMNGNKHFIEGNHDKNVKHLGNWTEHTQIKDFTFSRGKMNIHIVLCHYPFLSWNRKVHGSWHLFGHVHGRFHDIPLEVEEFVGLSWDVGIDNQKFYEDINGRKQTHWMRPVNLYEVVQIMNYKQKTLGQNKEFKGTGTYGDK